MPAHFPITPWVRLKEKVSEEEGKSNELQHARGENCQTSQLPRISAASSRGVHFTVADLPHLSK